MATELLFQTKFVKPLVDCYGQMKFPGIRIQKLWEKLKSFPDHVVAQCAEKIILNFDNFPGVQTILNTCSEVGGAYVREEAERLKASINCFRCKSHGVIQANNYAYKCTCQLGELLYPAFPLYQGQAHVEAKAFFDEDGNYSYEDGNYVSNIPAGNKDNRQIRTIIKDASNVIRMPDKKAPMKVLDFSKFNKKEDPA